MMTRKTYSIFNLLLCLLSCINIYSKEHDQSCSLEFEKIYGIKDFTLGTDIGYFRSEHDLLKVKEVGHDEQSYEKYKLVIQDGNPKRGHIIEYLLTFHKGQLVAYQFKIDIGNETEIYTDLINTVLAGKKNADFINEGKLRHWYSTKGGNNCRKYIRLVRSANSYEIKGGITNSL